MAYPNDELNDEYIEIENDYESGFLRWMSVIVVLVAVGGFFGLAWYAYHTGTQSIRTEDVALVEPDSSPMKEAPADPGGMQFPHQDKTVYETIASNTPKPAAERILPAPEEPVALKPKQEKVIAEKAFEPEKPSSPPPAKPAEAQAETWINKNTTADPKNEVVDLNKTNAFTIKPVTIVQTPSAPAATVAVASSATEDKSASPREFMGKAETPVKAKIVPVDKAMQESTIKTVEIKPETKSNNAADTAVSPAAGDGQETKTASLDKPEKAAPISSTGSARVQLGSFRSEKEATDQWTKISNNHASLLSGKSHDVVRADLATKGIYYRLQVTDISDMAAAKSLCTKLSAKKQPCLPIASK